MSSHLFPSEAWASAYKDALNQNPQYQEAGKPWTHGAVAMVVSADPRLDLPQDMAILLDVHAGICRNATYMEATAAREQAPFVIEGPYAQWARLIRQGEDPVKALMQGKLTMKKGHLPTLIRYVESSKQLLVSAQTVPSQFRGGDAE